MGEVNGDTKRVFLSYAEEDALTAKRVSSDLERSGRVSVWEYTEKGQIGADFSEEFAAQIRASQYFCLLDSPHSRRSSWTREECKIARTSNAIMVICILASPDEDTGWQEIELFEGHNLKRGIDLREYEAGIHELCRFLQIVYSPFSSILRDQDFRKELFAANMGRKRTQELLDLYRDFRENSAHVEFAEAQLRVIINKCEFYEARNVISPILALGVMHANAGRHEAASKIFECLAKSHPKDPRGWAGLGASYYHLGEYEPCVSAMQQSQKMILEFYWEESASRIADLVHNIASVQILLGRDDDAWAGIGGLSDAEQAYPSIRAVRGRLLLRRNRDREALPHLEAACDTSGDLTPDWAIDLANCYRSLRKHDQEALFLRKALKRFPGSPEICHRASDCFLMVGDVPAAISAMRQAVEYSQESPRYRAQFAALLHQAGNVQEGQAEARAAVKLSAPTAQDRYYRGLAYYVLDKTQVAEDELAEGRRDSVVARWPHYAQIFNKSPRMTTTDRVPVSEEKPRWWQFQRHKRGF